MLSNKILSTVFINILLDSNGRGDPGKASQIQLPYGTILVDDFHEFLFFQG
jgi:hypothetical protein